MAEFRWDRCQVLKGADDIGSWPMDTGVFTVGADPLTVTVRCDDSGWTPFQYSDGQGPGIALVGNFWIVANIDGEWYAAAFDGRRPDQHTKRCPRDEFGRDQVRVPPMDHTWPGPADGEVVGFFCSTAAVSYYPSNGQHRTPIGWVRYNVDGVIGYESDMPIPIPGPIDPTTPPPADWERRLAALEASALKSGDRLTLRAWNGQYVCAEEGGGGELHANRDAAGPWESFKVTRDE